MKLRIGALLATVVLTVAIIAILREWRHRLVGSGTAGPAPAPASAPQPSHP